MQSKVIMSKHMFIKNVSTFEFLIEVNSSIE
jgi:hypothetical protein